MKTWIIIGGGPSLRDFDFEQTKRFYSIAVNNAYTAVPWADAVFFGDRGWRDKFLPDLWEKYTGPIYTTAGMRGPYTYGSRVRKLRAGFATTFESPDFLMGFDSGTKAAHLAYHLGARRILLAGFDLTAAADGLTHWHGEYTDTGMAPKPDHYTEKFPPGQRELYGLLQGRGVEMWRVTEPGLADIPYRPLSDF